jgi:hypothetical protein
VNVLSAALPEFLGSLVSALVLGAVGWFIRCHLQMGPRGVPRCSSLRSDSSCADGSPSCGPSGRRNRVTAKSRCRRGSTSGRVGGSGNNKQCEPEG